MNFQRQPEEPIPAETYHAWQRRVRRIGGACQGLFAAWWLAQGLTAAGGALVGVVVAGAAAVLTAAGVLATRGLAPRPRGPGAARLERSITIATVAQIAVSSAAPAALARVGHPQAALPAVVLTVAGLLFFLGACTRFRPLLAAGLALAATDLAAVAVCAGRGQGLVAWVGLSCGSLQLGVALDGFHRLAAQRAPSPTARTP